MKASKPYVGRHGGGITVETDHCELDSCDAAKRELAPGRYVSLSVSDIGRNMPADVVARAFDPFFTIGPIGRGNGLGLSAQPP